MAKRKGIMANVARRPARRPARTAATPAEDRPGAAADAASGLMLADIAIRAGSFLARRGAEKRLLATRFGKHAAGQIVQNKTLGQSLVSLLLARVATRSVPGAIVVGGGVLAKALLDRRKARRKASATASGQPPRHGNAGPREPAADE